MQHWIKLIRPINLVLLVATMYFIDAFILQPNFNTYGITFTLTEFQFFLLVLSTVLICGAGYIINDYYDVEIDAINKPQKQIIGKLISQKKAFTAYLVLSGLGLAIGIYLSLEIEFWKLSTLFVIAIFLLYFYSASFKRTPLIGNIIVAFLAGLSILLILFFEPSLYRLARPADYFIAGMVTKYLIGISVFAFALTVVREVVKTMEDVEGDQQMGANTIAVKWGMNVSKVISVIFILFTIIALLYILMQVLNRDNKIYFYYLNALNLFLLFIAFKIYSAKTKNDYTFISTLIKVAMVVGICIMPLYYILEF